MQTILSVDDELDMEMLITQKFRRQIRNNEYFFVFAHNGIEALKKLIEYPDISLILSDINMPEMDGLTFLSNLKELKKPEIRTIMVSAYGDMENIRTAMNRGAFDFVTKPISFEDLEITMAKTLEEIETYRKFQGDRDKLVSIQKDLRIAYEIQQSMLPKNFPAFPHRKDFDLHGLVEPSKFIGGDLYDFFLIDEDHLFFMIGDVSGKGVPAALFMAITKTLFKSHFSGEAHPDIAEVFMKINRVLAADNSSFLFVTTFVCILDLKTGEVDYVDGGHELPLILRRGNEIEILKKVGNMPMALEPDFVYVASKFQLNPGDAILLYTDGLEDAVNAANNRYTIQSSIEILKNMPAGEAPMSINNALLVKIKEFIGEVDQFDDIAMLLVKFNGAQA
jgi:phosphoserine phosphatase RsbU/P